MASTVVNPVYPPPPPLPRSLIRDPGGSKQSDALVEHLKLFYQYRVIEAAVWSAGGPGSEQCVSRGEGVGKTGSDGCTSAGKHKRAFLLKRRVTVEPYMWCPLRLCVGVRSGFRKIGLLSRVALRVDTYSRVLARDDMLTGRVAGATHVLTGSFIGIPQANFSLFIIVLSERLLVLFVRVIVYLI